MRTHLQLLFLLVLGAGCGSEPAAPEIAYSADGWSGEVIVISHEDLENATALRLETQIRIGSLDGPEETQHFRVSDLAWVDDELWVVDSGDHEIRVYDVEGSYLRTIGREGDGPGEFRRPQYMDVAGDTILVGDGRRLTLMDRSGEVLATEPRMLSEGELYSSGVRAAAGAWVRTVSNTFGSGELNVLFQDTTRVYASTASMTEFGPEVLAYPNTIGMLAGELGFLFEPFYASRPVLSVGGDGNLYYSPGDEYRVDILDAATGAEQRRIVARATPIPVTDAMVQEAWRREQERLDDPRPGSETEMVAKVAHLRLDLPVPEARSFVGRLLPSPDGALLVDRDDLDPDPLESGDPTTWDVLGPDGTLEGRFATAPNVSVVGYDRGRVLAVERDDLGVQYVVVYRLIPDA